MSGIAWDPRRPLVADERVLIQASAGTGKTFQTEGLVVRLVAEQGVAIGRILVITFTRAATADLRSRVRLRLVGALSALHQGNAGSDEVYHHLLDLPDPGVAIRNLEEALRDFDQAPISTIHGFCQRTLDQLGFSAGVDPSLGLLGEPTELREQIVADTMARLYTQASAEQLVALDEMGWKRSTLTEIVKVMTGAEAPVVEPAILVDSDPVDWVVGRARSWEAALSVFLEFLGSEKGIQARAAYDAEPPGKLSRFKYFKGGVMPALDTWLAKGSPRSGRTTAVLSWLTTDRLCDPKNSKAKTGLPEDNFDGYPLAEAFTTLAALQDQLWVGTLTPFAASVRPRYEAELERRGLISYDTMLSLLAERLEHDETLANAMREQYDVAIVDEFQDTDGAQWGILDKVFFGPGKRLYVVGDPKQAIYRFRNANLAVYDNASAKMDTLHLTTNWRSDEAFVKAVEQLWMGATDAFLTDRIAFEEVGAAHSSERIRGLPQLDERARRPVELHWFDGQVRHGDAIDLPNKEDGTDAVTKLCAIECRALLESDAELQGEGGTWGPVRAEDIAVLVRTHKQGEAIRAALAEHGIPAIKTNQQGVVGSDVVPWVLAWLDAVAAPGVERYARALALTPLCGWSPGKLARALTEAGANEGEDDPYQSDRQDWALLLADIGTWAHNWTTQGFARVLDAALDQYGVLPRFLSGLNGERSATDLRHLFELLHLEERRSHAGPRVLAEWLRTQQVEAVEDDSAHAQRLESDASAVRIETIHGCKGLQYPIVMVPFGWTVWGGKDKGGPVRYSRPQDGGVELVVDLHSKGSQERDAAWEANMKEDDQENMRLLYVAMTRARHHLVMWAGAYNGTEGSALGRLLFRRDEQDVDVVIKKISSNIKKAESLAKAVAKLEGQLSAAQQAIEDICVSSGGKVGWTLCGPPDEPGDRWQPSQAQRGRDAVELPDGANSWDPERPLGAGWRLTSYSALSKGKASDADEPTGRAAAMPEASGDVQATTDEPASAVSAHRDLVALEPTLLEAAVAHDLPGGTTTGDWLHAIFEHLDFANGGKLAKDGRSAAELVADLGLRSGVRDGALHSRVCSLIPGWLATPLDAAFPSGQGIPAGFTLGALESEDRLDELRFDLRLGLGVRWQPSARTQQGDYTGRIHPGGVRMALEAALDDGSLGSRVWLDDLLTRTAAEDKNVLPAIAGMLTGFVDLCFRQGGEDGRYFVLDYKSNMLFGTEAVRAWHRELPMVGGQKRPRLRRAHYTRPMMAWGMSHAAYHLQALVYTVALHRLLRQRLGDDNYDYDRHIGGHLYLFLRGMEGPETPRFDGAPLGVWADRWPARTVWGLDAALDGGDEEAVKAAMDKLSGGAR